MNRDQPSNSQTISSEYTAENVKNKILFDRFKILYTNLLVSTPGALICATIIFISFYQFGYTPNIFAWYITLIIAYLLRLFSLYLYPQISKKNYLLVPIFMLGVIVTSTLWGLLCSFLMPHNNIILQMIIIIIIAGITSGGLQSLQMSLVASLMLVIGVILPLCIWIFSQNTTSYLMIGIAMSIYLMFMIILSFTGHSTFMRMIKTHYENLALLENLSSALTKLKHYESQTKIMNSMSNLLQLCNNLKEAYLVINRSVQELFPSASGGLMMFEKSTQQMETVLQWGDQSILKMDFIPYDCWGLREGYAYHVNNPDNELNCSHFMTKPTSSYSCFPLIVKSGVIGLVVLMMPKNCMTAEDNELTSFCEIIRASLYNILLREK